MLIWLIIAITASMLLYRAGGSGDEGRKKFPWLPEWVFNTKARDIGCALVAFLTVVFILHVEARWYVHLLSFILLFAALTTYWDFLFKFDNYWFTGFMYGLAYLPYAIFEGMWIAIIIRSFVLAILTGGICKLTGNDTVEEFSRGGLLIVTLPILLI